MQKPLRLLDGVRTIIGNSEFLFAFDYTLSDPNVSKESCVPFHSHAIYELHIVSNGVLNVQADKTYSIRRNEILIVPPHIKHCTLESEVQTLRYAVSFEFSASHKDQENTYEYFFQTFPKGCLRLGSCNHIVRRIEDIANLIDSNAPCLISRLRNCLNLLMFELCDKLNRRTRKQIKSIKTSINDTLTGEDKAIMLLDSIVSSLPEAFKTLDEISNEIHFSKRQINSIMKRRFDMTFKQKQIETRINYAKLKLSSSTDTVEQIGFEIGYRNLTSFYKDFMRMEHCTPAQFRSKLKDNTIKKDN